MPSGEAAQLPDHERARRPPTVKYRSHGLAARPQRALQVALTQHNGSRWTSLTAVASQSSPTSKPSPRTPLDRRFFSDLLDCPITKYHPAGAHASNGGAFCVAPIPRGSCCCRPVTDATDRLGRHVLNARSHRARYRQRARRRPAHGHGRTDDHACCHGHRARSPEQLLCRCATQQWHSCRRPSQCPSALQQLRPLPCPPCRLRQSYWRAPSSEDKIARVDVGGVPAA